MAPFSVVECTLCGTEFDPREQFPKHRKRGALVVKCPECRAPVKVDDIGAFIPHTDASGPERSSVPRKPAPIPVGPPEPGGEAPPRDPDGPFQTAHVDASAGSPTPIFLTVGSPPPGYRPGGVLQRGLIGEPGGLDPLRERLLGWLEAEVGHRAFFGASDVRFTTTYMGGSVELVITATGLLRVP